MANLLQAVETYNEAGLQVLENSNPFIFYSNKKFENYKTANSANLGSTINFKLRTRFLSNEGTLVATPQDVEQRIQSLTVSEAANIAYSFSDEELIFNVEEDTEQFVKEAVGELDATVGANIAQVALTNTYRAFGDGFTAIDSDQQYAQAIVNFRNYGAVMQGTKLFVSDVSIPPVISNEQTKFVVSRNNISGNSWEIGSMSGANFYSTNLLPTQYAGEVGNGAIELTLTGISGDGKTLTFSSALPNAPVALAENDILTFDPPGATNSTGLVFLTFTGHIPSRQLVQQRVTADAISDGAGNITVTVTPGLIFDPTSANRNVNIDPTTLYGVLNATSLPDHQAGLLFSGNPLFVGMPKLNNLSPFVSAVNMDQGSGAAMRSYYGSQLGLATSLFVNDLIYGKTLVDEMAMRLVYPLSKVLTVVTVKEGKAKESDVKKVRDHVTANIKAREHLKKIRDERIQRAKNLQRGIIG